MLLFAVAKNSVRQGDTFQDQKTILDCPFRNHKQFQRARQCGSKSILFCRVHREMQGLILELLTLRTEGDSGAYQSNDAKE